MARKKVPRRRKRAVMKITARKGQVIRQLAQDMGVLVPATAYGKTFCFRALADEFGLAKYWREKHNKTETISQFLQQVFRHRPRMPFKIVREVVSRGVERGRRTGVAVTRELLDRMDDSLCELGYDMHAEIANVKLDEVTAQAVAPSKEIAQVLKRLGLHPAVQRDCTRMFENGHLNEAVRKALERFEKLIQDQLGDHKTVGQGLMAKAFNEQQPLIALNEMKTANDQNEQQGFKLLTMGAMAGLRNLYSHGDVPQMLPTDALERLAFVSLLFKRVDAALRDSRKTA